MLSDVSNVLEALDLVACPKAGSYQPTHLALVLRSRMSMTHGMPVQHDENRCLIQLWQLFPHL